MKKDVSKGAGGMKEHLRALRMVAWGFFGVRKKSGFEKDVRIHPLHVVAAGLLGALMLVLALVLLVRWVAG